MIVQIPLSAIVAAEKIQQDSVPGIQGKIFINNLSLPIITFTSGSIVAGTSAGRNMEASFRNNFNFNREYTKIDDYTQFAPAAFVFILDAAGIKGKYKPKTQLLMYSLGVIGTGALVQPMKIMIGRERPNGANLRSFPSGHTSIAFTSAEFLNQEFGKKHPWISVVGYATAGLTGYLRMYNDAHWLGDVLAGAAIGMTTTKLVYFLRRKLETKKNSPKPIL